MKHRVTIILSICTLAVADSGVVPDDEMCRKAGITGGIDPLAMVTAAVPR